MSTPVRRQYLQLKKNHPNAILFFRMGDFYEAFDEDATTIARELNIVLTAREVGKGNKVPMAGVPHHAADTYIARLVKAGYKVAICEQIGREAINGLMPREVVRVVTPGTVVEPALLEAKQANYLAALTILADQNQAGLAYVDITTGEFSATLVEGPHPERLALDELARLNPAEIIIPDDQPPPESFKAHFTPLEAWRFEPSKAQQSLLDHFEVSTLSGFGLAQKTAAIQSAGAILQYLIQTQPGAVAQIISLKYYSTATYMALDSHTRRNLELTETLQGQKGKGSVVDILDQTITPMGGRLLRAWIQQPLLNLESLNQRLDAVEAFYNSAAMRAEMKSALKNIADVERLAGRINQGIASPKDLVDLRQSLHHLPHIISPLKADSNPQFEQLAQKLNPCSDVLTLLNQAIVEEPPAQISKGGIIQPSFSAELESILNGSRSARQWIASVEKREREATGIKTLKVGFNKVFGYYLEVTKANTAQVPDHYIRKQTLVNAERYITPDLKEYENIILNAEERQIEVETRVFQEVIAQVASYYTALMQSAHGLAHIDVYQSLGQVAAQNNYIRPELYDDDVIDIVEGRHPVVEQSSQISSLGGFVPNDTKLSNQDLIWIITGPNMSGKSTLLRQVALIILLAQTGSFVPANSARIGLVDRIFTRIGAQDEIHAGQSTFMVEMVETAAILAQSTPRSLLILDEIGRGTSTYDGLAIARAIIEYIHNNPNLRAKTLFATHYHELVELEQYLPYVKNYNVAATEEGNKIVFLHKIIPGGADRSYGIHVAQLAGIPRPVISRATEILADLENDPKRKQQKEAVQQQFSAQQLSLFGSASHPALDELKALKIEELSPLEALNKLYALQKQAAEDNL